jgi:hypothetical protein
MWDGDTMRNVSSNVTSKTSSIQVATPMVTMPAREGVTS